MNQMKWPHILYICSPDQQQKRQKMSPFHGCVEALDIPLFIHVLPKLWLLDLDHKRESTSEATSPLQTELYKSPFPMSHQWWAKNTTSQMHHFSVLNLPIKCSCVVSESPNPLYFYSVLTSMSVRRCLLLSAIVRRSRESTIASLARRKVDGEKG